MDKRLKNYKKIPAKFVDELNLNVKPVCSMVDFTRELSLENVEEIGEEIEL